jgi:hypothetical protein
MTKSIKTMLAGLIAVPMLALGLAVFTPVTASVSASCSDGTGGIAGGVDCANGSGATNSLFGPNSIFTTVINTLLYIIGALSVVMLIVGGIRYVVSNGTAAQVTAARNTITYAIVGLIIAFLAYAIVNWVLVSLTK